MTTEREELAEVLVRAYGHPQAMAKAVLAAGWSRLVLDDATVERAARALYIEDYGAWVSGQGVTPGGTPWGTSLEQSRHAEYFRKAEAVLAAAVEPPDA